MPHLRRRPKELTIQERHIYHAELDRCPSCGEPLHLCGHYNSRKTVQQLDKVVYVASRPKVCCHPTCAMHDKPQPSARAQGVALYYSTYGLDVVAQIGWWRDQEHLSGAEIHRRLQGRIQISRRHVDLLLQQYRLLLACAEAPQADQLAQVVATYGGLILSIDGLEPEGAQEQLWSCARYSPTASWPPAGCRGSMKRPCHRCWRRSRRSWRAMAGPCWPR